jgi:hypothetical protein
MTLLKAIVLIVCVVIIVALAWCALVWIAEANEEKSKTYDKDHDFPDNSIDKFPLY